MWLQSQAKVVVTFKTTRNIPPIIIRYNNMMTHTHTHTHNFQPHPWRLLPQAHKNHREKVRDKLRGRKWT